MPDCNCTPSGYPEQELADAAAVFTGKVTAIRLVDSTLLKEEVISSSDRIIVSFDVDKLHVLSDRRVGFNDVADQPVYANTSASKCRRGYRGIEYTAASSAKEEVIASVFSVWPKVTQHPTDCSGLKTCSLLLHQDLRRSPYRRIRLATV
jgi:hypothetical protein